MRCTALFSVFLLALFACSCETDLVTGDPVNDATDDITPSQETVDDALSLSALSLVNTLRAEGCTCGGQYYGPAPALALHPQLQEAAAVHSADQAARRDMNHVGSDGSRVGDRVRRAGFDWRGVAENVAWNQRSVAQVVNAWKGSAGHCRNLMNPDYEYMGFAQKDWYWTQVFAR